MQTIRIGFKAFDPHELLVHFIAVKSGFYEREALHPQLVDTTFIPDEEIPEDMFQVSCGAALMSALKGLRQRVVFVATDRPMFWIYGNRDVGELAAIKGGSLATYPDIAPPAHFARIMVQQAGLDPDADVSFLPTRDDTARIGLLRSRNVDAAILGSAVPPPLLERHDFHVLSFVGNGIRIPTTGLASHTSQVEGKPELIAAVVRLLASSLEVFHENPAVAAAVLQEFFGVEASLAQACLDHFQPCFTESGRTTRKIAEGAIAALQKSLGDASEVAWTEIYDFRFLEG